LEGCVARVAECMAGDVYGGGGWVEGGFVRALGEVVRGCEGV